MFVTGEMFVTGMMFVTDLVSGIKGLHDPGRARALAGQRQGHAAQARGVVTHVAVKLISAQVLKLLPKLLTSISTWKKTSRPLFPGPCPLSMLWMLTDEGELRLHWPDLEGGSTVRTSSLTWIVILTFNNTCLSTPDTWEWS